jgi:hypothetical protein
MNETTNFVGAINTETETAEMGMGDLGLFFSFF